jgi:uncharacterized membrane protein YdjX (TVP38/TMEM64 family)
MKRNWLRISAVVAVAMLAGLAVWKLPARQWVEDFIVWIRIFGAEGAWIYGVVYGLGVVLMVPGSALTLGAGLVYGPLVGMLIVSPASVLGATGSFLVSRYFARDWVERKLRAYPKFSAIDRAIEKQGFKVILLVRLQPALPFVLLNYALGLTRVRLRDYILASWIGMMPGTLVYVYIGSALHNITDLFTGTAKHSPAAQTLFWGGLAAGIALLMVLTRIAKHALHQELDEAAPAGSTA